MEVGTSINFLENVLRDIIESVLSKKHGISWLDKTGLPPEKIESWRGRLAEEPRRRPGGMLEQRLIYYSEFYDLENIINKNWNDFKPCLGDKKKFEVYMSRLSAFRNPDAHSRALLPFEEHLVLGITGEIRQTVTMFLSQGSGGPEVEYFPRIEEVKDNFGLRVSDNGPTFTEHKVGTSTMILRPKDVVLFEAKAWDPENKSPKWLIYFGAKKSRYELEGLEVKFSWQIEEADVAENSWISIDMTSERNYHRHAAGHDSGLILSYKVLPNI